MSVAGSREEFIGRMRTALNESVSSSPTEDQVRRYLRTFISDPQGAIEAYRGYASNFFVHVDRSRTPGSEVVYPGGHGGRNVCDNLAEVMRRPLDRGRHIIDCRGFSLMAVELLREAGFTSARYMIAVPPDARGDNWAGHVFVRMSHPNGSSIYISNDHIYNSPSEAVEHIAGWSPDQALNVRYGVGDTYQEALEDAMYIVEERDENPLSDVNAIAPLRSRRRSPVVP